MSTKKMSSYEIIHKNLEHDKIYERNTGIKVTDIMSTMYYNNGAVFGHLDNLIVNENNSNKQLSTKDFASFTITQIRDSTILSIPESIIFRMIDKGIDAYAAELKIETGYVTMTAKPGGNVNIFGLTFNSANQVFILDTDLGRQFYYIEDLKTLNHVKGCRLIGISSYEIVFSDLNANDKKTYINMFVIPYLIHLHNSGEVIIQDCEFGFMPQFRSIMGAEIVLDKYSIGSMMVSSMPLPLAQIAVAKHYFELIIDHMIHTNSGAHTNAATGGTILRYSLQSVDHAQKLLNDHDIYNKFIDIWNK